VLYRGRLSPARPLAAVQAEQIGLLMAGSGAFSMGAA
jgi:hypothetical protein